MELQYIQKCTLINATSVNEEKLHSQMYALEPSICEQKLVEVENVTLMNETTTNSVRQLLKVYLNTHISRRKNLLQNVFKENFKSQYKKIIVDPC